ncbi:ribonucleoprotein PTB-binding 2 isoform X4 [Acipenser ruthenus]|uniref:ribonucleoprotein PTB-binding 2 isoform X4 n=1 Tax=Acipenser ruthenus TaxID=7906 RepID=UPI00145AA0A4|nr:ribonucleoprotein PTB-binding 2 isoform X4 [Acipenser ruthenus]
MAAASSFQLPLIHNLNRRNSPVPDSDSPENRQDDEPGVEGPSLRVLADLEPEEIERRLEKTRRELSNRRKILMKNLPQDISNQEVHDILKEYELKYCYVDRNKGTAFVTLLNGEQAQDAIRIFHQTNLRGRELSVQLQPTDSLLCITNLPHTYTLQQFEELVRMYGNIERCFLACSEVTGHSKGYGFVEYMKKDSASKARSELLGRQLGDRTVMVQWTDVNQLTADNLHSKCLCVDKLPSDFSDSEELEEMFSKISKPVFCQLAQDEGSPIGGFAVLEYETAEQAEEVLREMDRQAIGGSEVRVSFCAPGTAGRSTLAALIAAQGVMANKKGLLPEPSIAQMLNSMTNPAALQVLMRPYHAATAGKPPGIVGLPQGMPYLRSPPLTAALLQLGKVQQLPFFQNAMLGNGLVLQNIWRMQLAHQQLVQLKEKQAHHASSLFGDPSRVLLQKAMGMRAAPPVNMGKGLLGDSPNGLSSEAGPTAPQTPGEQAGMMAYMSSRRHLGHAAVEQDRGAETQASAMGGSAGTPPGGHGYLQGLPNPMVLAGAQKQQSLPGSNESSSTVGTASSSQTSLLGEPPKELKVPSNPYLNMASVLPGVLLQAAAPHGSKPQSAQHHSGVVYGSTLNPTVSQTSGPYAVENTTDYSQQYGEYSQEAMQQWYQHYQAQGYASNSSEAGLVEYGKEQTEATATAAYGDYNSYMQAVSQYYSQTHMAQAALQSGYQQRAANKEADMAKAILGTSLQCASNGSVRSTPQSTAMPAYNSVSLMSGYVVGQPTAASSVTPLQTGRAGLDWSQYYYNNSRGQKRDYSHLPSQEATPEEGYVGQHSQGLGGQYADLYFKKKRI